MTSAELRTAADRSNVTAALGRIGTEAKVEIPIGKDFLNTPIDELNLTVRARNGLMRARLDTVGKLADAIMSEPGLECIRNLGKKSISEIKTVLLTEAYARLGDSRRDTFWEKIKELNGV